MADVHRRDRLRLLVDDVIADWLRLLVCSSLADHGVLEVIEERLVEALAEVSLRRG